MCWAGLRLNSSHGGNFFFGHLSHRMGGIWSKFDGGFIFCNERYPQVENRQHYRMLLVRSLWIFDARITNWIADYHHQCSDHFRQRVLPHPTN